MKILVVEDEEAIRNLIGIQLEMAGYEVIKCGNGLEVKDILDKQGIDLVLLDVMIPGIDGFSLIKEINVEQTPVIFLTARESVVDRVQGLRLGADDYIVKPFEPIELVARIETALRRYKKQPNIFRFKDIELYPEQRMVKKNGNYINLTVKEYDLLELFIRNKNIAMSREQILDKVWGFDYFGMTRTVDTHVQRIREKLDLKDNIKTVFKVGYRLEE